MLGFAYIISVFRTGWRFARVWVGTRYPEHVAVSRSVNGDWCMFVLVYFRHGSFYASELRLKVVLRF